MPRHAGLGVLQLRRRKRDAGDVCPYRRGGVLGETAPAAADFQNVIALVQIDKAGERRVFLGLGFDEAHRPAVEPGR